jgi:16S rRNA (guanine527-N7)-methyltransferase
VDSYEIIEKYFTSLTDGQTTKFVRLRQAYDKWNGKINVVSRKDIDCLYTRHVLHSLAIARIFSFRPGTEILDVGTGGGFPAVPLAIMFPETRFTAVDSIGKKIMVLNDVIADLGLSNIVARQERAENIREKFDFVTCRAVTNLSDFAEWVKGKIKSVSKHDFPNGIICLKGGDLTAEIQNAVTKHALSTEQFVEYHISDFFDENFFETKKIIYIKNI